MFRRLLLPYLLATLAIGLVLALLAQLIPVSAPARFWLVLTIALATLANVLFCLLICRHHARQMSRSLADLTSAIEQLRAGKSDVRVFPIGQDELSTMGRRFNHMSEELTARIAKLEEDHQQLKAILSGMVEGVVALDAEQRILFVNDRGRDLLDLAATPPVGRHLWEVVRHRQLMDAVNKALLEDSPCRVELQRTGRHSRSLMVHAARLLGTPPRGAVVVLHDISELRRLERLRQDFVANVSHELKTPLSVIKVCVETLQDGADDDPVHRGKFLDRIAVQAERLHALILDLLSLARIESGEELFEFQRVALDGVALACLERHMARAEARQQKLEASGPPLHVWADEEAVDQILENLLDNALKYTPEGGTITVRWREQEGMATVEVSDTGIGIPEADLPRIFERFYRVDKARARELGGTGLGLSIVKHLVQAMHGTLGAQSEVGKGTRFTIGLPLDQH